MKKFIVEPTTISEWYALVSEAQQTTGYQCDEHVENYLILTLDKFTTDDSLATAIIAIDFLQAAGSEGQCDIEKLRSTGDRCLLLSGLFPECAQKINVSVGYFVDIGQQSYRILADRSLVKYDPQLFFKLSDQFTRLADLLTVMRDLQPSSIQ